MDNNELKSLLVFFQYASIICSGILGLFGLLFNFKNKDTGRLTKWGLTACFILTISLSVGVVSKTVELEIQKKKENSEATKARIAAEQTLKIVTNVERIANAIEEVNVELDLTIPISAKIFENFKTEIHQKMGISNSDRDLDLNSFKDLVPKNKFWEEIVNDLVHPSPVIMIYPKGVNIPSCIIEPIESVFDATQKNGIRFKVPMNVKTIGYPQLDERFGIKYKGRIVPDFTKRPQILSLVDFNDATIVIYMAVNSVQREIKDSILKSDQSKKTLFKIYYNRSPSLQYDDCSIDFSFNGNRYTHLYQFKYVFDTCSRYPYFIGQLPSIQ